MKIVKEEGAVPIQDAEKTVEKNSNEYSEEAVSIHDTAGYVQKDCSNEDIVEIRNEILEKAGVEDIDEAKDLVENLLYCNKDISKSKVDILVDIVKPLIKEFITDNKDIDEFDEADEINET